MIESLTGCLADVLAEHIEEPDGRLVIAYEPVWAIGTGKTATADDAQEMCRCLRERLGEVVSPAAAERTRMLYGGSVKAANAAELLSSPTSMVRSWAARALSPRISAASSAAPFPPVAGARGPAGS